MRNIQDVIVVGMSNKDEIRSLNVRIDGRGVWRSEILPSINPTRVPVDAVAGSFPWRGWSINSRKVGINNDIRMVIVPSLISHPLFPSISE